MNGTETYAAEVVGVLRGHFPGLADPVVAEVTAQAIEKQARDPHDSFMFIVDDPIAAKWRLYANSGNPRRVHIACHRASPRPADSDLEATVNEALRALEAGQ